MFIAFIQCPRSFGIYYSRDINSTSYTLLTTTAEHHVIFIGEKSKNTKLALFIKVRFESCYGYPGQFSEVKTLLGIEKGLYVFICRATVFMHTFIVPMLPVL